jgi:hypothetical protein
MVYTYDQFLGELYKKINVGKILDNPGGGTSKIVFMDNNKIVYRRGKSKISIKINDIFEVYEKNKGNICSNKLKEDKPYIFDSKTNGHSCNCTFIFMIFKEMGVVNKIEGAGVRGNPFYVIIKK